MLTKWTANERKGEHVDALFWTDPNTLDQKCQQQIRNAMRLPFAVQHVSIMPDAHGGYGVPIGSIIATRDVVMPNAVGVDIGCGMIAARIFGVTVEEFRNNDDDVREEILRRIPVGPKWRAEACKATEMPDMEQGQITAREWGNARRQLGTLGGGNHFIEIQESDLGDVWVMIHSGSRNLGKQVCDHYAKLAKEQNRQNYSLVPPSFDLGFFHKDSDYYERYLTEMAYCVYFAKDNRAKMMVDVLESFKKIWHRAQVFGGHVHDICHNHVNMENHFGRNVLVHRKGAAGPYFGSKWGIIPGSMGANSYLVSHSGSQASMMSTSHGAGRAMSRSEARKSLDLEDQQDLMELLQVNCNLGPKQLDEAPGAYKNIETVMNYQMDLCKIERTLRPMLSIKG